MDLLSPLAPIFAASVAVQQTLEVISVLVEKWVGEQRKKAVLGGVGFLLGILVSRAFDLDLMAYFQLNSGIWGFDTVVTAMVLSAGTEGTNSIVKFLKYLKEDKKATAAETLELLRKRSEPLTQVAGVSDARKVLAVLRARAGVQPPTQPAPGGFGENGSRTPAFNYISGR